MHIFRILSPGVAVQGKRSSLGPVRQVEDRERVALKTVRSMCLQTPDSLGILRRETGHNQSPVLSEHVMEEFCLARTRDGVQLIKTDLENISSAGEGYKAEYYRQFHFNNLNVSVGFLISLYICFLYLSHSMILTRFTEL